jgi:hypothetical protein
MSRGFLVNDRVNDRSKIVNSGLLEPVLRLHSWAQTSATRGETERHTVPNEALLRFSKGADHHYIAAIGAKPAPLRPQ